MIDVTDSAEPALDIWPYVRSLYTQSIVSNSVVEDELVEYVYRTETSTFDHVLLTGMRSNQYVVIVIDLKNLIIKGYYLLDLNVEYDL